MTRELGVKAVTTPSRWVDDHGDVLFRFALIRVRNSGIAEELVQETFLAALQAREKFEGKSDDRTWLIGILKHKILDYFRKRAKEHPIDKSVQNMETFFDEKGMWRMPPREWAEPPDKLAEKREFWETLSHCMDALSLRDREAFVLSELDEVKGEDICKLLGVTATNLWVLLHRARNQLRRCLEINWFGARENDEVKNA